MAVLREDEIEEMFCRSGGPGGQHVNKVSTAVTLRHIPTGLVVVASDTRSQSGNRALARQRLAKKLLTLRLEKKQSALAAAARDRRRRAKRSRKTKSTLVENKRRRGATKKLRGKIHDTV